MSVYNYLSNQTEDKKNLTVHLTTKERLPAIGLVHIRGRQEVEMLVFSFCLKRHSLLFAITPFFLSELTHNRGIFLQRQLKSAAKNFFEPVTIVKVIFAQSQKYTTCRQKLDKHVINNKGGIIYEHIILYRGK